jgi:hypothetical protein
MSSIRPADPRAELRRMLPVKLVLGLHHLVKACLLYSNDNQAVTSLAPAVAGTIADLCAATDAPQARLLFADQMLFVDGRLLKGPREATAIGQELGALVTRARIAELTFERRVPAESLTILARALADAAHDPAAGQALLEGLVSGVAARWVDPSAMDALPEMERSALGRVVQGYASAVLQVRRAYEALERGELGPAARMKRVAQALWALCEEEPELCAALSTARFADADPARLSVSTAVVALLMARRICEEPTALAALAAAALLADVGRLRLGDLPSSRDRYAASALVVLTALGKLDPAGAARAVIAHEALRLTHGPPLAGCEPLVLARVLRAARRFNGLRLPAEGAPGAGVDTAVEAMRAGAADAGARAYVDLLVSGLGFFPLGALVELDTGEIAVVMGAPALSVDFARPEVQLLADKHGVLVNRRVDLAHPAPGQPRRAIVRALAADREALAALHARMARRRDPPARVKPH